MNVKGPLPFVIAVVGHRDLVDEDLLEIKVMVKAKLEEYINEYPSTPLILLSALAEGADRLVAKLAIELNFKLVAILPMPKHEYLKDFKSEESKADFHNLLDKADRILTLGDAPWMSAANNYEEGENRNQRYANLGIFLVNHAQDLLSLSNEGHNKKTGGTTDIISYKTEGLPGQYLIYPNLEMLPGNGSVWNLNVRRSSEPEPVRKMIWSKIQAAGGHKKSSGFLKKIRNFFGFPKNNWELFNRKVIATEMKPAGMAGVEKSIVYLTEGRMDYKSNVTNELNQVSRLFGFSDFFASKIQSTVLNLKIVFLISLFLFTAFLEAAENLPEHFLFFHNTSVLILAGLAGFYFIWHLLHLEDQQIDFRVLAEGFRIVFFWKLAGINKSIIEHYPIDPRNEMDWQRRAVSAADIICEASQNDHKNLITNSWLEGQKCYFSKKMLEINNRIHWIERIIFSLIFILFAIVLSKAYLFGRIEGLIEEHEKHMTGFLDGLSILFYFSLLRLPTIIALIVAYLQITGNKEMSKQYQYAKMIFEAACRKISNEDLVFKNIVTVTGIHALRENTEWCKIKRDRPLPEHPL